MEITNYILFVLMTVESGGNINAVGDDGKAFGLYQIHAGYAADAGFTNHDAAFNPIFAQEMVKNYMARYATEERIGRPVTVEDICRIHNGGPNGYKRSSTDAYWAKCKKVILDNNLQGKLLCKTQ
jgi:hypothetical protein|tara:strand:+ start:3227 stop:3601 length:375 start_codon:yes stop_codon:yes gene_type:complete